MHYLSPRRQLLYQSTAAILVTIFLGVLRVHEHGWPKCLVEWPVSVAPMVTLLVALMAFLDFGREALFGELKNEIYKSELVGLCSLCMLLTFGVCLMLTSFKSWPSHLAWLAILFLLFLAWDFVMLRHLQDENHRRQISSGNRLVNRPTLMAIIVAAGFLAAFSINNDSLAETNCGDLSMRGNSTRNGESTNESRSLGRLKKVESSGLDVAKQKTKAYSDQEMFVAGLVCFHLIVAACGYLALFFRNPPANKNAKLRKLAYYLFSWLPDMRAETDTPKKPGVASDSRIGA